MRIKKPPTLPMASARLHRIAVAIFAVFALGPTSPTNAQYWWVGGDGSWGSSAKWTVDPADQNAHPATPTFGSSRDVIFNRNGQNGSGSIVVATLDAPTTNGRTINQLQFLSAGTVEIRPGSQGPLRIAGGGIRTSGSSNGTLTINVNTELTANQTWDISSRLLKENPLDLGANALTVTITNTDVNRESRITGVIQGSGSLTKTGGGELRLAGTNPNTYTGATVVTNNGVLALNKDQLLNNFGLAIPGSLTITDGGTVRLDQSNQIGDSRVDIYNATLNMQSFDDTVGELVLVGGTISGNGSSELGRLATDARRRITSTGISAINTGTMFGDANIPIDVQSGTLSIDAAITNFGTSASITKSGGGILHLTGANNYTGSTTVNAGTLRLGNHHRIPDGSDVIINGGAFALNGFSETIGSLSGSASGNVSLGGGTLSIGANGISTIYSGSITGSGQIVKTGSGLLTLSGTNDYADGTTIFSGALYANDNSLGQGGITFNGGTLSPTLPLNATRNMTLNTGATIDTNSTTSTLPGVLTGPGQLIKTGWGELVLLGNNDYQGGTHVSLHYLTGHTNSIKGNITFSPGSNDKGVTFDQGFSGNFAGSISGDGWIAKRGAGNVTLQSNSNGYTKGTYINQGTLTGSSGSFGSGPMVIAINSSVNFQQNGGGQFTPNISGAGSVTKTGAGTLTLAGNNSYGGNTVINQGTLEYSTSANLGSASNGIVLANGATLRTTVNDNRVEDRTVTLPSGVGVIDTNSLRSTFTRITGGGGLHKVSGSTLNLSGPGVDFTGPTTVSGGTLGLLDTPNLNSHITNNLDMGIGGVTDWILNSKISGPGTMGKVHTNKITLTGNNDYTNVTQILAGTLQVGNGGATGTLGIGNTAISSGAVLIFNRNDTSYVYGGNISGGGTLSKAGTGTVTLTGNNSYGTTLVNSGGTLRIGNGGTSGTLGNGSTSIGSGGILEFNRSDTTAYSGVINGFGSVVKNGAGTLTLGDNNSYGGGTVIIGGVLSGNTIADINSPSSFGTGNIDFGGGATLRYTGAPASTNRSMTLGSGGGGVIDVANALTVSGVISGNDLTKTGAGTLTLSGTNGYAGTIVSSGTLIGSTTSFGTGPMSIASGGLVIFQQNSPGTFSGNIGGGGTLSKAGTGTLTLTGNNSYGTTLVNSGGTLRIGNGGTSGTLGNGSTSIGSGGILEFNRSDTSAYDGSISGFGAVVKNGAGPLTLSGNSNYSGGTTINGGSIFFDRSENFGNGPISFNGGAVYATSALPSPANVSLDRSVVLNSAGGTFNSNTHNFTLSGAISGNGALTKSGAGTLSLNGALSYAGGTTINAGTLKVNGVIPGSVAINDGVLRGSSTIHGSVTSNGTLAPGNSPGIIHIDGDYTQGAQGVLEIEVGGKTTAGGDYDKVEVGGSATLGGLLRVPLIDVPGYPHYTPAIDDEIVFLTTGNGVSGKFDALLAPGLENVPALPNGDRVAIKVFTAKTSPSDPIDNEVHMRFVRKQLVSFTDTDDTTWDQNISWSTNTVPETFDTVTVQNNAIGGPQRLEVVNDNAFSDQLILGDPDAKITIGVHDGKQLSAGVRGVSINKNGVIELGITDVGDPPGSSTLASTTVSVGAGGMLSGNGTVVGNLVVGATSGGQSGTLDPGFGVGELLVEGNYTQQSISTLMVDVTGAAGAQHDSIDITGAATLDGTLRINAAGFVLTTPGAAVGIIDSPAAPSGRFTNVETTGNDEIFFSAVYPTAPGGATAAGCTDDVCVGGWYRGDMNRSGGVDRGDIPYFALALNDPVRYFHSKPDNVHEIGDYGQSAGDLSGPLWLTSGELLYRPDGKLTYDDIPFFAAKLGMTVPAFIAAMQQPIPEPSSIAVCVVAATLLLGLQRRRPARHNTSTIKIG